MRIPSKLLKSILLAAGKKDVRQYLCGVHINSRHIVATDGHRLHAYSHSQEWVHGDVTIPRDAIEMALKARTAELEINDVSVGAVSYRPVDGKYPDYMRVIPAVSLPADMGTLVSSVFPAYIADAQEFIAVADGRKAEWLTRIGQAWTWQTARVAVVVVGERLTEKFPVRTSLERFQ